MNQPLFNGKTGFSDNLRKHRRLLPKRLVVGYRKCINKTGYVQAICSLSQVKYYQTCCLIALLADNELLSEKSRAGFSV